jgi:2-C-methyl-D-erythritol 4-phosphate cytidylyltransferase
MIYLNNKLKFTIKKSSIWEYKRKYIKNIDNNLYLNIENNNLILTENKSKWDINNNYIKNEKNNVYMSFDINYNIYLTENIKDAKKIIIDNKLIYYVKPDLIIKFEKNNKMLNNFSIKKINKIINNAYINNAYINNAYINNVVILLAGGMSTRFNQDKPKQLYLIDNKPIILYSIEAFINCVDKIVIISNSTYFKDIKKIVKKYDKVKILINDINCRLESIYTGLKYLKNKNIKNIIIHDACRPYIKEIHIKKLIEECKIYSQYYIKLNGGLYKKDLINYEIVNRDDYIEIATPLCINYELALFIYENYIDKKYRIVWEFINILDILNIKYNMIEGHNNFLRKITTYDDLIV